MIDIAVEETDVLARAGKRWVPRGTDSEGKPRKVSASTMWRWAEHGVAGIRLETICIGSARYTSREAIQRFFTAVTAARSGGPTGSAPTGQQPAPRTRTEAQRRKDNERAREQLGQMIANPPKRRRKAAAAK